MKKIAIITVILFVLIGTIALYASIDPIDTALPVDSEKRDTISTSTNTDNKTEINGQRALIDIVKKGGPFMWIIVLCAGGAAGFAIERVIFFKKHNLSPREFIQDLESEIENSPIDSLTNWLKGKDYRVSEIIIRGLKVRKHGTERMEKAFSVAASIEVSNLERGLNILSAIGNIAPMLGFLGTVSGMITAFGKIASADQVNARLVAGGIEEALLTTAAGLIVAIPTLFLYNYFVHRIDIFISDVERVTANIIEKMIEHEEV